MKEMVVELRKTLESKISTTNKIDGSGDNNDSVKLEEVEEWTKVKANMGYRSPELDLAKDLTKKVA